MIDAKLLAYNHRIYREQLSVVEMELFINHIYPKEPIRIIYYHPFGYCGVTVDNEGIEWVVVLTPKGKNKILVGDDLPVAILISYLVGEGLQVEGDNDESW